MNKSEYNKFLNSLYNLQDIKYKEFYSKLGINGNNMIGIRVPMLKKIAKDISKNNYISFIKYNTHNTYEEILIHGLIICYINDFDIVLSLLSDYIQYIDNWALCDTIIANLHIWRNNTDKGLNFVIWCLKQENMWYKRVGYVLLLEYYINNDYLDTIFNLCNEYQSNDYYVKMAIAWLISICYIKYPNKTLIYIKDNKLDDWIHNKAIQKIRESKRIDKITKDMLLEWRKI